MERIKQLLNILSVRRSPILELSLPYPHKTTTRNPYTQERSHLLVLPQEMRSPNNGSGQDTFKTSLKPISPQALSAMWRLREVDLQSWGLVFQEPPLTTFHLLLRENQGF